METPYSSSLGEEGPYLYLLPRSFFLTLPVTKHSKKKEQQCLESPQNKVKRKNTNSMHAFLPAQVPCLIHPQQPSKTDWWKLKLKAISLIN